MGKKANQNGFLSLENGTKTKLFQEFFFFLEWPYDEYLSLVCADPSPLIPLGPVDKKKLIPPIELCIRTK